MLPASLAGLPRPREYQRRVLHFTEARLLSTWLAEHRGSQFLALVDYELLRQELTGLDVIEREGIAGRSILVTSRYAEPSVLQRAAKLGLKIIPKELVGLVPIVFALTLKTVDAPVIPSPSGTRVLVIDDDEMIAWAWRKQQKRLGVAELRTFSSMEACKHTWIRVRTDLIRLAACRVRSKQHRAAEVSVPRLGLSLPVGSFSERKK